MADVHTLLSAILVKGGFPWGATVAWLAGLPEGSLLHHLSPQSSLSVEPKVCFNSEILQPGNSILIIHYID